MVPSHDNGIHLINGTEVVPESESGKIGKLTDRDADQASARKGTTAYSILEAHNISDDMEHLRLWFDGMASRDIIFVGIVQITKTSGVETFLTPYVLTSCHSTLCAVEGIINEDDYMFGLSAAKRYGGIYVSPHIAVIHQYMKETMAGCSRMILDPDSHTRYGALEIMAIGENGGEPVKQFLKDAYDMTYPGVVAVYLDGTPRPGTGPQDITLAIAGVVFKNGYVENKVMESVGPGVASMITDCRNGVDVMTTETARLPSTWKANSDTGTYPAKHHRKEDYKELAPADVVYYDGRVYVDLSTVKSMITLPFHPSNTYEVDESKVNLDGILGMVGAEAARVSGGRASFVLRDRIEGGQFMIQRTVIAGCVGGTYSNVIEAACVLKGKNYGYDEFSLAVYPSSQPVLVNLVKKGAVSNLMDAGVIIRAAFCGPCFGAGDTPCNSGPSIHHATRNFPNREGPKPDSGQMTVVTLMGARSIAATAANGGRLTSTWELEDWDSVSEYEFDDIPCKDQVYMGYNKDDGEKELIYGPNIKNWSEMGPLADDILLKVCSKIMGPVTTIGELIPSSEASPYRSNPLGLAEFTLFREDPEYVGRVKEMDKLEKARIKEGAAKEVGPEPVLEELFDTIRGIEGNENVTIQGMGVGSIIYAVKPGDGFAREQTTSCQRVVGGLANICRGYVTKRYRFNVMNRGMIPFQMEEDPCFEMGDYIYVLGVRKVLGGGLKDIRVCVLRKEGSNMRTLDSYIAGMTAEGQKIVKAGCLINYNKGGH